MLRNRNKYFIGVNTPIKTENNFYRERVYFNSAAFGLPLRNVVKQVNDILAYYIFYNTKTNHGTELAQVYENVQKIIYNYVQADANQNTALFVNSSTAAIYLLSRLLAEQNPEQVVLVFKMNELPGYLPFKRKLTTDYIEISPNGDLDLNDLEQKLKLYNNRVRLVAITGASNITGITPQIYQAARLGHSYGAQIFVDATQLLPHQPFDMKPNHSQEHIDFISFSAHKCYSPYTCGVLVGPADFLSGLSSANSGLTQLTSLEKLIYGQEPQRYQTGRPPIIGIIGLGKALESLKLIGLSKIAEYEKDLYNYARSQLQTIEQIKIYGLTSADTNVPYLSFTVEGKSCEKVAEELGFKYGIVIGYGQLNSDMYIHHLLQLPPSQAYVQYLNGTQPGLCRVSLAFYNTRAEVDWLIYALRRIIYNS